MPTPPTLKNSPNTSFSPIGNAVPAINTGASKQAPGTASFGKVLAQEINDKSDAPENSSTGANSTPITMKATTSAPSTALNNTPENENAVVNDSKGLKNLEDVKDLKESKDIKDLNDSQNLRESLAIYRAEAREIKETKTDTIAVATSSRQMGLANILHGLIAAYSPNSRTGAPTAGTTQIPADVRTDTSVDAQAERIPTAAQYDGLTLLLPGLVAAHPGKAETDADASAALQSAAGGNPTLWTPGMPAGVATIPARVKHAVETQDIHQGARKEAEIKVELGSRRAGLQQTQFRLPELSPSVETGTPGKPLPEFMPQGSQGLYGESLHIEGLLTAGLPNTSAMPTFIAAEHSAVPTASGTSVQPSPWLEPRIGATGWDNSLGEKVLWMVSNQLQVVELNLNPPDLGPLQVILSIDNDQASATFVSQHVDVRQALEAALPRLKEMMAESGISLGDTTVSADTPQQRGGFERQDSSAPRQGKGGGTMTMSNAKSEDVGMSRIHKDETRLVDTFA